MIKYLEFGKEPFDFVTPISQILENYLKQLNELFDDCTILHQTY